VKLRNRVYHNEPICWNLKLLEQQHQKILKTIHWLDNDLALQVTKLDTFPGTIAQIKYQLKHTK
jgi:hypothetical protein